MRQSFLLASLLAAAALAAPACNLVKSASSSNSSENAVILPFPAQEKTLPNGLKIIVVKTGFPNIVSLQIPVKTGSRNEVEPGKSGFAHFFEHMMFRGTKNYPPEKYQAIMTKAGARQNAFTTSDFTNYHITFAGEDLEKILEIEADRFQHLDYSLAAFQTEARAVLGEYNKNFANPISKLFEVEQNAAFTDHPYKHTTMGFIADIENMPNQFEYSKTFFDRWYRPENTTIVLVGDLDASKVFSMVEKYWAAWKPGNFKVHIPQERVGSGTIYHAEKASGPMPPLLAVAFRGAPFDEKAKDMAALELMTDLYFGDTSDIYNQLVRNEQKIDLLFGNNATNEDPDLVNVVARIKDPADLKYVRDAILKTLARAAVETIDPNKLADAKSFMRYSFAAGLSSNEAIGSTLARYVRYRRSFSTVNELFAMYQTITPEDIRDVTRKYVSTSPTVVTVMAHEDVPAELGAFESIDKLAATMQPNVPTVSVADLGKVAAPSLAAAASPAGAALSDSQVVVQRSATPQIVTKLLFETGSVDDPPGKEGLAELSARMIVNAGSQALTLDEISKRLYPIAGDFGARVDREMTVFTGSIHKDNLDQFVAIALEQLLAPGYREEDFKRNLETAKSGLLVDLRANNDEELGKERLQANVFAGSGYAHPTAGTVAGLDAITLEDVKQFVAQHYTSGGLTLAVSGDISEPQLNGLRGILALRLPKGAAMAPREKIVAPPVSGLDVEIIEKDTRATALSLGHAIDVRRGDPDFAALNVARAWLGEHRSSMSWLYQRLRELRGMNYGDYAYIEAFPRGGSGFFPPANVGRHNQIFEIWIRPVPPNQAHFALRAALYEFEKLVKNGLTKEQFETTREYLMKNVYLLTDGQDRSLGYALDSRFYGTPEYTKYMRDELAKLTVEQVNAAMQKHFSPANLHVVFVTKDADGLAKELLADEFSEMKYTAEKPADVLSEDKVIGAKKLGLKPEQVRVTKVSDVFAR